MVADDSFAVVAVAGVVGDNSIDDVVVGVEL